MVGFSERVVHVDYFADVLKEYRREFAAVVGLEVDREPYENS